MRLTISVSFQIGVLQNAKNVKKTKNKKTPTLLTLETQPNCYQQDVALNPWLIVGAQGMFVERTFK